MKSGFKLSAVLTLSTALAACGYGGGSNTTTTTDDPNLVPSIQVDPEPSRDGFNDPNDPDDINVFIEDLFNPYSEVEERFFAIAQNDITLRMTNSDSFFGGAYPELAGAPPGRRL
ncbi:MAG: hypothetical protein HQK86_11165 [Nitrospinae bacterium]|nr:hypothetical protein [Nitrospinota bacterium]MBF0634088.1 hypothetical protein [Nitrospinota bacterium]